MFTSFKLKNQITKIQPEGLEFDLHNTRINGQLKGCCGFIKNLSNDRIVYVNTEGIDWIGEEHKNLYRTAKNLRDYTGGVNRYANDKYIAQAIVNLLNDAKRQD